MSRHSYWRRGVLAVLVAVVLTACGAPAQGSSKDVNIRLTDFDVISSTAEFQAGVEYTFTIVNQGQVPHEFMFIPPVMEGMADMHGEATHNTALIEVGEDKLPPGATYTLVYTFPQSVVGADLEIACHTPGHYEAGMRIPIVVK
jgi:uncharacterized cupredoxin-like copper-binding protein